MKITTTFLTKPFNLRKMGFNFKEDLDTLYVPVEKRAFTEKLKQMQ